MGGGGWYHCDRVGRVFVSEVLWSFVKQVVSRSVFVVSLKVQVADLSVKQVRKPSRLLDFQRHFHKPFLAPKQAPHLKSRICVSHTNRTSPTHQQILNTSHTPHKTMAEPRARVRQKGQVFSSDDRKQHSIPSTSRKPSLTPNPSLLPPRRLRRPPATSPRHHHRPRLHPHRLHNRILPLRRAVRLLQPAPKDQKRRLQIRAAPGRSAARTRAGAVVEGAEVERGP